MESMTRWLLVLGLSGCAFALQGPEGTAAHTYPRCDDSKRRVVADGLIATGLEITALAVAGGNNSGGAVVPALAGVAFIASAVKGNSTADDCRKAQERYAAATAARAVPVVADEPQTEATPASVLPIRRAPQTAPAAPQPPSPTPPPPAPSRASDPWAAFWKVTP